MKEILFGTLFIIAAVLALLMENFSTIMWIAGALFLAILFSLEFRPSKSKIQKEQEEVEELVNDSEEEKFEESGQSEKKIEKKVEENVQSGWTTGLFT
ncbi:hypothetical protein [Nitratiruptor sp. YY09-18]|uniref:hypothetical protein n=1 Tax=Nitratiruptor sp. YY09-18 TaxID=2724901 RepID=UPI001915296B|nr:hypothetical protein [Nitratiruptor sp. YY09-18]BCD68034.1 hypothetical protein NitYY0918_C0943 [Nitratiruptor sp. YY09-18]